ncbi:hypothetical protein AGABI1DRAFT_116609 [Agaricus bisporus var. burnettii JB137-S8]|uniref:Altered inheritance of mitochondria protein 6 n=1 Tax=Agaricus bisporus var. burnettii (strain JB137-S8 / ATCC MYA-4627 / FGSC 10392) TaxID=597362 RepID=K5WW77_AGABU|nr:hypothetical protein AGABI2DRAFT_194383 [Agaricus bisporus var. bisporus H97]XP_007334347.1 uncharacterized protein AGABI1DRAFT_116609 [Agaricus bisporus var. burnettii JB137-S8]EKM75038.1 hypothetical protein AGABI1DRAFT_116609 [Agaricus bisporus var. burnettii JB137-S8]EKV45464.1 hypothetical protein AGABI2DRAFT_194383 [Agaricus bisporus var. bisporus H97]
MSEAVKWDRGQNIKRITALLSVCTALPIHSHNDYLQDAPLFTALDVGILSVEADVWLRDGQLYVAHTEGDIDTSKTFQSLYLQPILDIIEGKRDSVTKISVDSPLQLLIDFKSNGDQSYGPVLQALSPLRDAGHLTTFKDGQLVQGAVTAVGTGNTPLDKVLAATPRDLFYDAHIQDINDTPPAEGVAWGPEIAPLASANFPDVNGILGEAYTFITGNVMGSTHDKLIDLIGTAHSKNMKSRFYGAQDRDGVYLEFLRDGSDYINADRLEYVKDLILNNS